MARKKAPKSTTNGKTAIDEDGFEIIGGSNAPIEIGEVVEGEYCGVVRHLPPKRKGQAPLPVYRIGARDVLGGTVLKQRIEDGKVKPGDTLRITRLEDAPAKKGQNPAKLFDVRVKRQ
jgi:hypothetical protein